VNEEKKGGFMESAKHKIRLAVPADAAALAEFGARSFDDSFAVDNRPEDMAAYIAAAFNLQKQTEEIADPASVFLIAEIGNEMAGYARVNEGQAPPSVSGDHPIELVRIYAGKTYIGQGIGPALMQACLDAARKRGCDTMWLGVWERNPRAIAFYRKWGFVEVGTQTFQLGSDLQTDVVMQRAV
jgi:diamine N-acetyltransferase